MSERVFLDTSYVLALELAKDYSLTDCISFVVMRNLGIAVAYTFDRHFVQAGFAVAP